MISIVLRKKTKRWRNIWIVHMRLVQKEIIDKVDRDKDKAKEDN